jgi:hypothetical protein
MLEMEATHMDHHDPNDQVAVYIREVSTVEPLTRRKSETISRTCPFGRVGRTTRKCREKIDRESAHVGREHRRKTLGLRCASTGLNSRGKYRSDERRQELRGEADWRLYCTRRRLHRGSRHQCFWQIYLAQSSLRFGIVGEISP